MDEWLPSVYEYLCTSKELLENSDLSDKEAEILRGKIEYFSALLDEEMDSLGINGFGHSERLSKYL